MAPSLEIVDDDELLRRLAPDHVTHAVVNSLAFSGKSHEPYEISVNLRRLTTEERTLAARSLFGVGMLRAGDVRALGLEVVHDPVDGNDAHCLIVGEYSKGIARNLARITRILRSPRPSPERVPPRMWRERPPLPIDGSVGMSKPAVTRSRSDE